MENNELHVIIGTGPLGLAIMDELRLKEKTVRVVNRSGKADVPTDVEVFKANTSDQVAIRNACQGATAIYHCAKPSYTEWPEKFPILMDQVIDVAMYANAKIIYADNLYMYGPVSKKLSEGLPNLAKGRKGKVRAQIADRLLEAHRVGKIRATIGRGSDFFGPRVKDSALGDRVFGAMLQDRPAEVLGNIDLPHTYIYIYGILQKDLLY